jgi:hypothetical protein
MSTFNEWAALFGSTGGSDTMGWIRDDGNNLNFTVNANFDVKTPSSGISGNATANFDTKAEADAFEAFLEKLDELDLLAEVLGLDERVDGVNVDEGPGIDPTTVTWNQLAATLGATKSGELVARFNYDSAGDVKGRQQAGKDGVVGTEDDVFVATIGGRGIAGNASAHFEEEDVMELFTMLANAIIDAGDAETFLGATVSGTVPGEIA